MTINRGFTDPHQTLTDVQARALFRNHGLSWWSSGNCSDRTNTRCTSFEQVRAATVVEAVTLQQRSGCPILLTGGTETGHATGTRSHWHGYKVDLDMTSCVSTWVSRDGTYLGASKWRVGTTVYYNEVNHWDVQVNP